MSDYRSISTDVNNGCPPRGQIGMVDATARPIARDGSLPRHHALHQEAPILVRLDLLFHDDVPAVPFGLIAGLHNIKSSMSHRFAAAANNAFEAPPGLNGYRSWFGGIADNCRPVSGWTARDDSERFFARSEREVTIGGRLRGWNFRIGMAR